MKYFGLVALVLVVIVICADAFKFKPDRRMAVGPCIDGKCQPGFKCHNGECFPASEKAAKSIKRPQGDAIGPCIGDACPAGYFCDNGECRPSRG